MLLHSMCTSSLNFNKVLMAKYKVIFLHFILSSILHSLCIYFLTVQCPTLMNGNLQCLNGATIGVFEGTVMDILLQCRLGKQSWS